MSLRPSLSAFSLRKLQRLFGSGDTEIESAVVRSLRKAHADNLQLRVRATQTVHTIVHRGRAAEYPRNEDDAFQIIVNAVAQHGQDHVRCTSIFWEQFFAEAHAKRITSPDRDVARILHELIAGRPLFGSYNASSWAYYAYLLDDQVVQLRDFVRADPRLSQAFGAADALAWLDATCEAGLDVWCWVS
jgi:hypothetical protein